MFTRVTMPRASPASLAGALLAGALLLAAAAAPARAQPAPPAPVRVGFLLGQGSEPFTYLTPDGTPAGFEVELMRQLCAGAGLVCAFTPLPSLEDRIVALVNGSVDASIGRERGCFFLRGRRAESHAAWRCMQPARAPTPPAAPTPP
jgi:ABC-type amino acid transport substrate-binding protein